MPVRIRLSRIGKKKVPFYRMVAVDGRKKRDGECLQDLGTYDALNSRWVRFDQEGVDKWLSVGAQPSESALKLIKLHKREGASSEPIKKSSPASSESNVKASSKKAEAKTEGSTAVETAEKPATEKKAEAVQEVKKEAE